MSNNPLDLDMKTFLKKQISQLSDNVDSDPRKMLPKKSELFVQKVLKDDTGQLVVNEEVHNIMHRFRRIAHKKGKRKILILGCFGHGKTEQMVVGLCLEKIAKDPNILIKIVHVSDKEAVNRVRAVSDYIKNDPDFKKLCPHIEPTAIWGQEKFIVKRKTISKDPTMQAFSVLSSSLGGRAHLIVYDDINDLKSAVLEPGTRENIQKMVTNVWDTRLIPGRSEIVCLMNRWHESLCKYSELLTKSGFKEIQDFKIGDEVLTSKGIFEKVTKTHKGLYNGYIFNVVPHYFTFFNKGGFTADHEILTKKDWKFAQDLTKDDYLVVPIPKYTKDWLEEAKKTYLEEYKYKKKSNKTSYLTEKISKEELQEFFNKGLTYKQIGKKIGCSNSGIYNLCRIYEINNRRINDLSIEVLKDIDFWRILGYWIAEGSFTETRKDGPRDVIRFSFGAHEKDYIEDVKQFFNKYNIHVGEDYTDRSSCNLKVSCMQLAKWIKINFDEFEHNKRLPEWFYGLPEEQFFEFLNGYIAGDGHENQDNLFVLTSVSKLLLFQIQMNLLRFNIISSSNNSSKSGIKNVDFGWGNHNINCRNAFSLKILNNAKLAYIENGFLYVKIYKIKRKKFFGFVYDITTPSHDFTSPAFIVHNSDFSAYVMNNPTWAWMSIAVSEDKENLLYEDSFGKKKILPLWSKYTKKDFEDKHISMGDRDYNRAFRLIAYSDYDKSFPSFETCCSYGINPIDLVGDMRDWVFCGAVDFSGIGRKGTTLVIGGINKQTNLKIPIETFTFNNPSDLAEKMIETWQKWGTELYLCENNAVQEAIMDLLGTVISNKKLDKRFSKVNIKIEGFNTGRNKLDPSKGLPSLEKEMKNKEWLFCFPKKYIATDQHNRDVNCRAYKEMLYHPFFETNDLVMTIWILRSAFQRLVMKSNCDCFY